MKAIILAGGLGTRLRSVVSDVPKPMVPVADRPFLDHLFDYLAKYQFDELVLSVGYKSEAIIAHYGDQYGSMRLRYVVETSPMGTGGALALAVQEVDASPFFVINGDTWVGVDYLDMWNAHAQAGAQLSVAAVEMADTGRYGRMRIEDGYITGFEAGGEAGAGVINAGVYLMDRALLLPPALRGLPEKFSFEAGYLQPRVATLRPLAFSTGARFIDIGVPDDYRRAQTFFAA